MISVLVWYVFIMNMKELYIHIIDYLVIKCNEVLIYAIIGSIDT